MEHLDKYAVTVQPGRPRTTRFSSLTNAGAGAERVVYASTLANMEIALRGRFNLVKTADGQWCDPPKPEPMEWDKRSKAFWKRLRKFRRFRLDPMTKEQFINTLVGSKRTAYTNALLNLEQQGLLPWHTVVRLFLKKEKQAMKGLLFPIPRVIRPMAMEYNLELGVYIKPLEKLVYKMLGEMMGGPSVSKGMDAFRQAAVSKDKLDRLESSFGKVFIQSWDIAKFERCVSVDCHEALTTIMCKLVNGVKESRKLRRLLEKQYRVRFVAEMVDGKIKFNCVGTLCSGVMNTSLWAVVLMFIALIGVGDDLGLRPGIDYDIFSAGDDTNTFVPAKHVKKFIDAVPPAFLKLGFYVTLDNCTSSYEHMDFCQTRPVYDGTDWRLVREPTNARGKDVLFIHDLTNKKAWDKARGSIADCGLALCYGLPVMQSFYLYLGRGLDLAAAKRNEDSGFGRLAHGRVARVQPVTVEARVSFWEAFGVTPSHQVALEELYDAQELQWRKPSEVLTSIKYDQIFE